MNSKGPVALRIVAACVVAFLFFCNPAGAAEDELARARREDQQLCSTPEGLRTDTWGSCSTPDVRKP